MADFTCGITVDDQIETENSRGGDYSFKLLSISVLSAVHGDAPLWSKFVLDLTRTPFQKKQIN